MNKLKSILVLGTALASCASPVLAQDAAQPEETTTDDTTTGIQDIIVTARRSEERLQDVPVAVSVVSPAVLEARGSFNPVDLRETVPGLSVTASTSQRTNLTYTIRGQGFSFGTLFPAVITYFNEVPITQLTEGQFFDLENVQVLRGPQGVAFGRVTDGGNVMLTARRPSNEFEGSLEMKVGDYNLQVLTGVLNVPIIDDAVLLRGALEIGRRDGFTRNAFNGQDLDNVHYNTYRLGLTLRPSDRLENTTTVQYQETDDNGTGVIFAGLNPAALGGAVGGVAGLFAGGYGIDANGDVVPFQAGLTPFTTANLLASQQAQLTAQQARGIRDVSQTFRGLSRRDNLYVVNSTIADLTDSIRLTNIFGYTHIKEDQASNFTGSNGGVVLTCVTLCPGAGGLPFKDQEQFSEELRISGSAIDGRLNWAIGGYMDEQRPSGPSQNSTINVSVLQRYGVLYSKTKSRAVYGSAEFEVVPNLKINGGLRYTRDTVNARQATYIRPIPGGEGALFNFLTGPFGGSLPPAIATGVVNATFAPVPNGQCVSAFVGGVLGQARCITNKAKFNATTWQAGASYQTDGGQLFYGKISKGYRPGGVNGTAPVGADPAYAPEFDVSLELGVKADWDLNGVFLRTNLAAYRDRYTEIQKNVVLPGPVPVSLVQNVNDAVIKGVEFEATLIPFEGLTLGGTFAYTDAKFDRNVAFDPRSCDPTATALTGFCPFNRFNSVPKTQYSLLLDYEFPFDDSIGELSVGGQLYHQSNVALTDTSALNPTAIEPGYTTLNLRAAWKNAMGTPIDLGAFVTNVTGEVYRIGNNNLLQRSSLGTQGDIYAAPRMWGFSVKFDFGADGLE